MTVLAHAYGPDPPADWLREPPMCGHPMRGGALCNHDAGHRGKHCSVAWRCDGCGKTQRGQVFTYARDGGDHEYPYGLAICFMCAAPQRNKHYMYEV